MISILKKAAGRVRELGGLNIALLLTFAFFLHFNAQMVELYKVYGSIPESYALGVVAATIGEAGICGWIRTTKERERERKRDPTE